jgi:hypothetical protein
MRHIRLIPLFGICTHENTRQRLLPTITSKAAEKP